MKDKTSEKTPIGIFDTADLEKEIIDKEERLNYLYGKLENKKNVILPQVLDDEIDWLNIEVFLRKGVLKERQRLKAEVAKIIDEIFPICICPDGNELNHECKNEWVEGWSSGLNEELKKRFGIET